jgi:aspartyl-tRNA(Asn)/glutamyl-tRNA(Gln) amidotransferase subunit A
LRPSYGLVSRRGAMALSWTLDKIGPLCRSVEDCAIVLQAISGSDVEDPGSAGKSFYFAPKFARKPTDFSVGYAPVDFDEWADESARPALKAAVEVVKGLGVKVKEVEIPDFPYSALTGTIIAAEAASIFEDILRDGRADQMADKRQVAGLKIGLDITAVDYLKAMRIRALVQEAFRRLYLDVDFLLSPSRLGPAPKVTERLDAGSGRTPPKARGLSGLIPAGNLAGLPALSLPCGLADGMPVAISLVGRPFFETQLIALGMAFQAQTDWHRKRPPMGA